MTHNIPRTRPWRVTFWKQGKRLAQTKVLAPTATLARLNLTHEQTALVLRMLREGADRTTMVSMRGGN